MSELLPYQERVVDELQELLKKLYKLSEFIEGKLFSSLDESEKENLTRQFAIMNDYAQVLRDRIESWL